ncbi:GNAT family N-acetyltransferase [Bacillus inaquosorum]|uniref:GNAT family acetyltransferase n=3 Tax=Bacillus inaquosorum TaxID=483913 RepID=A0A9W5PF66_9BACI|nr:MULTISPECIES: GNAT family N-acetyltransferase [Bacillus subtilis group]MCY8784225.1 GNAT family N-acetyltransferase [Bacillus spizizenii]AWM19157.1 GNAT family N-acetyltransferase [Bacillus inaquosorum]ELS63425.1 GNAT family acetyltransferase [Bacillus inaquosorum KCTC 13429]MCY7786493.1 GNAT family N-acetyltransferase [Bacillus inaquosorum]MCY7820662.1 GNAT family N-acetyltransferase [Bacillus inaquosorum]
MNIKRITTENDLHVALDIRRTVFIEEQHVAESDEFDEFDTLQEQCQHILVYHEDQPVGTGRVRIVDHTGKLERICILKPYRKYGLGQVIISGLENIMKEKGMATFKLHGQTQAAGFYKKLGYQTSSQEFMEDGIPHVLMTKDISRNIK